MSTSLPIRSTDESSTLETEKAKLSAAVAKFDEHISTFARSQDKSSTAPALTLEQITASYQLIAANADADTRDDKFGKAVEKLILANVQEEPVNSGLGSFSKKTKKVKDGAKMWIEKTGTFMGKMLPLAVVACGMTAAVGDGTLMAFPLKAVANGAGILLQFAQKESERADEFIAELDRISYQSRRVSEIQKHPRSEIQPLLLEKSLGLMTAIVEFLTASLLYWKHGFFYRVGKTILLGPDIWQSALKDLRLAYAEYDQALLLQIASTLLVQSTEGAAINKSFNDDALNRWLSPSRCEVEAQLLANRIQRAEGTLQWILQLEKFKNWRLSDKPGNTPASTFWINGLPGVGKSTISAYVYDLLVQQYPENPILYFFCKNGTPRLNTAHDIVRTMAYQLSETYPTYRRYLQTIESIPRSQSSEKVIYLFEKLIKKPLLQELRDSDIFIVLDGLDELENTSSSTHDAIYNRKLDIEVLLEHLVLLPRTKILVTSRLAPELMKILGESGATHTITRGDNAQDITTYSETRVKKSPKLSRGFKEIGKDPIKYFADKSNGIFLWVAIVLDILERAVTTKEFSEALENPPSALNNLYDQVFTRAKAGGNYSWIIEILNWTLVAQKPFTTEQMKKAVELSTGDKLFEIETLLRSECGSFLELIPVLGTKHGKEYEVHLGHETLQAYLTGTGSNDVLISKIEGHGRAALGCIRCLLGAESSEDGFHLYATEQWIWHLRKSMGRDSDEQRWGSEIEFVDSGDSLPPELARSILICLYQLFTTERMDLWLEHEGRNGYNRSFYEVVQNTCEFVGDWYNSNAEAFEDPTKFSCSEFVDDLGAFNTWRLGITSSESIGSALWPRCCHIWLWNTWPRWWDVFWAYESLMKLDIWTHHSTAPDSTLMEMMEIEKSIRSEAIAKGYKRNQKIIGRINVRNANVGRHFEKKSSHNTFMNIFTAGGADELSGVCQSNLAIGCYYTGNYCRGPIADNALEDGIVRIQDALDENTSDFPRNYETLGRLYESQSQKKYDLAVEAYQRGIEIDPEHLTGCRNQYYLLKRTQLIERENPDYDATIELLEEAIKEDPENAMSNYMHLLADLYKKKEDLDGTRKTLRASIAFDPSCSYSQWDNLADTYVANINNFEDASDLDRRNWCDVLAEAAVQDPSHAFNYWDRWVSQAESLERIHHFQAAIDMLEYGIQKTSEIESLSSKKARPKFELSLGNTLCSKAKWTSAVAVLEDALKHEKKSDSRDSIYMSTGKVYLSCGRYNEAEQAFLNLLDLSYDFPDGRAHLAEVYLLSGKYPQALKEYKTVIQQESQAFKTWKEDAYYHYREYRDLSEGRAWLNLGCVYDRMKRTERAVDCFKRAVALFELAVEEIIAPPDREEIWRWHGRVLASLAWLYERVDGDSERAEKTYAWAVKRFELTVWKEDDELENSEWREAEQAWERVKRGEKWVFPGEESDVERRKRYRALSFRSDWCVRVGKRDSRMMRGHG